MNANDGLTAWSTKLSAMCEAGPVYCDGFIYVGDIGGNLYCLAAKDGSIIWSLDLGDAIRSEVAVGDGAIYVASDGGKVVKVR